MKRTHLVMLAAGFIAVLVLMALLIQSRSQSASAQVELAQAREAAAQSQVMAAASRETSALLEQKLTEVAGVLKETTDKLEQASQRLAVQESSKSTAAKVPVKAAPIQLPEPRIALAKDTAGRETRQVTLPKVYGVDGRELANEATFVSLSGRRLIFRRTDGPPTAFDVDQVHPEILAVLNIDADAAKQKQYEIDQQKREQAEAAQKAYQGQLAVAQKLREQEAALRRDQAREAAEQRKIDQQRAIQLEALDIERQKAQAAMRQADAAIIQALNPTPVFINPTFSTNGTRGVTTAPTAPSAPVQPQAPTAPTAPTAGGGTPPAKSNKAPEPRRL